MNDSELDELLDEWKMPAMRDSLREEARAGFAAMPRWPGRRSRLRRMHEAVAGMRLGRLAAATMGAGAVLFVIAQLSLTTARTASPGFRIPFYVEFEFARYGDSGTASHVSTITSFPYGGYEIVMSVVEHSGKWPGFLLDMAQSVRNWVVLVDPSLVLPKGPPMAEPAWFAGFVNSGCSSGRTVVGHEVVAGHAATVLLSGSEQQRIKVWMAPDLACYALKLTHEVRQPDGSYRLEIRKEAVKVTMNP